jgi:hypothetical protein
MEDEKKMLQDFRKSIGQMKREMEIKECFHPNHDECVLPIKLAHSLQRNGRLSLLEEKVNNQNSLYTFTSFKSSMKNLIEDFIPVGKGRTSTFNGFCSHHDTNVFSPIENYPFDGSEKHLFLHSYRSFAHSYHNKKQDVQLYKSDWKALELMPKYVRDQEIAGAELGLKDLKPEKEYLDDLLLNEKYDGLTYSLLETDEFYPFGCSSLVNPHYTVLDKPLDDWHDLSEPWISLMITAVPDKDNSFAIIAGNPNTATVNTFFDELDTVDDEKYELVFSTLMTKLAENTFWSPKLWDKLSISTRQVLINDANFMQGKDVWDEFPWSSLNLYSERYTAKKLNINK